MADTHETIADIIAEMRGMGNYQRYSGDHARVLAGRLEAAHRRERGDAAKLREALVQAELFVGNIVRHGHQTLVPGDKCTACDGAEELRDMICAALSALPRNCDRPECATTKAAADVWRKEDGGKTAYHEWLLATAMEQEGGDDGK